MIFKLDAQEALSRVAIRVKVRGVRRARLRIAIATWLIVVAGSVLGGPIEVESGD